MEINIQAIHAEAKQEAARASAEVLARNGGRDRMPCGFAWVNVYGVKLSTKLGRRMAQLGYSKSYEGGIQIWNPSGSMVQNIDAKLAGAEAYAGVLRKHGLDAHANSRLD